MATNPALSDDRIYDAVEQIFRDDINPMIARHGGKVELVDVQEATVVLRLMGGCQGCGMATVTLRQGIETALRQALPGLRAIKDITDHGSGKNPYYAPGATGKSAVE
jgi:Fe/S biogenesis protein NfuA